MVEDTRKVQNEKVVMLRAGSGEAVNPRRVAGAKIVMTSGVMPNIQAKTTTVTPSRNTSAGQDGTTQPVDINPDSGYTAMTKVTVSTPQLHQYQKMEVSYVSDSGGTEYEGDTPGTTAEKTLVVAPTKDGMAYEGAAYRIHPDSAMGDAQPADVLSGKTFTSASGIAQVGTGSGTGNLQEKTTTVTPAITTNASATTTQSVEIPPDTGYDGMSKVNVSTPQQHINGLVNVNGVSYGGSVWNGDTEETYNDKMLIVTPSKNGMAYTRASNGLLLLKPSASMGNATAADVRQGKTFTSSSGIAQTGSLVVPATIYGATWSGGSSPAWTRTDGAANFSDPNPYYSGMSGTPSSPFDAIMPWAGMRKVTSNSDVLVEIPKYWYKWTRSGASMQLQISSQAETGFFVSPAHADRGDGVGERDYVYVGRYHCSGSSASMYNYKSLSGVAPKVNETRTTFRSGIHNLGANYWQWDFAMHWTIAMLYLVEFADWNSQAKIGYGCGNSSSAQNTGASDTMPYHTGTMQSSRSTYGVGVQYRYIEGLWDNVYDWVDGIYNSGENVYCIKNPANFSDNTGGTLVGTRATALGWTTEWTNPSATGFEYALYPNSVVSGLDPIYTCDQCSYDPSGTVVAAGGGFYQGDDRGLFYISGAGNASSTVSSFGSRLMVLPSAQLT